MINFSNSVGTIVAKIDHTARVVHSVMKYVDLLNEARKQHRDGTTDQRYASSNLVEVVCKHNYRVNEVDSLPEDKLPSEYHIG